MDGFRVIHLGNEMQAKQVVLKGKSRAISEENNIISQSTDVKNTTTQPSTQAGDVTTQDSDWCFNCLLAAGACSGCFIQCGTYSTACAACILTTCGELISSENYDEVAVR